jgi:hypothetical protein
MHFINQKNAPFLFFHMTRDATACDVGLLSLSVTAERRQNATLVGARIPESRPPIIHSRTGRMTFYPIVGELQIAEGGRSNQIVGHRRP